MTLTQLNAFLLVARLGSVTAAASALGVTEPAVSQALAALRQHLGDPLLTRGPAGMALTPGGARLLGVATQMVALGAEAEAAVRQARGAPEQLRVVATSTIAEFIAGPLLQAFGRRYPGRLEVSTGVAATAEMPVLVASRLADLALGPSPVPEGPAGPADGGPLTVAPGTRPGDLDTAPVFRCKLVFVAARGFRAGANRAWKWLVDPSGTDPGSTTGTLLRRLGVPERRVLVFPSQTAAWAAAADGAGIAPAPAHLVGQQLRRGELALVELAAPRIDADWYATTLHRDRRSAAVSALRSFLGTPEAMRLMRSPAAGVPPSRFRPPVYVTIWS
jgi:DNA-binding transcriptional LysR family regulator